MGERDQTLICSDGSTITVGEIYDHVTSPERGIIHFREIMYGTAEALIWYGKKIDQLAADFDKCVLLVDLSDATHPSATYREAIVEWMKKQPSFHQCFVQPHGTVQRVALRFMLGRAGINVTVHKSVPAAIETAREKLANYTPEE